MEALADKLAAGVVAGPAAFAVAFLGGLVAGFGPCILPMVPAVFSAIGVAAGAVGRAIVIGRWAYFAAAAVCLALGLHMLGIVQLPIDQLNALLPVRRPERRGLAGSFLFGMLFGLVTSPCSTPILAAIATIAAVGRDAVRGADALAKVGGVGLLFAAAYLVYIARMDGEVMGCCSPDREILVEVKRLVVDGTTCERCGDAWNAAIRAVRSLEGELAGAGVSVRLVERPLPPERIDESNSVLVDGRPVEEWLAGEVTVGVSECPTCSEIVGEPACCRTYEVGGEPVDALDAEAIARAIRQAAAMPEPASPSALRVLIVTTPECG
ncbi:MAG: DUF2703 domain-containing protein [Coriobacteriia bacterium]|nr:DUF2703 domain-containing protein [Coriobacteriia bacterium]